MDGRIFLYAMRTSHLIVVLTTILLSTPAWADTLAVDQFNYSTGPLHLANGGSGWYREWRTQNAFTVGYEIESANPLTYFDQQTTPGYCVGGYEYTTAGRYFDPISFASYQDGNGRIGTGNFFFTFLIRKEQDDPTPVQIVFADDEGAEWAINQELIKVGYLGGDPVGPRYWGVSIFNDESISLSDSVIAYGETYRLVVEIDFGSTTTVNLWVNPGVYEIGATPDASVNTENDVAFWNIVLSFVEGGENHGSFDEFVFTDELSNVLPVEYLTLGGNQKEEYVELHWSTATEIMNETFQIEHSTDLNQWTLIGETPGNGDSSEPIYYQFRHYKPSSGLNYYRLRQVDFDGNSALSKIILVSYNLEEKPLEVYQLDDQVFLKSTVPDMTIRVFQISGIQELMVVSQIHQVTSFTPSAKGIYLVTGVAENKIYRQKFLFQ